jgi:hypothetical protein
MVLALSACSFNASVGGLSVEQADVEQQISDQLEALVGRAPESVSCPGDLEGTVGATLRCSLTDGGETLGVDVEVTAVEGDLVDFDIQVDDAPS